MEKIDNIYDLICKFDNIQNAFRKVNRGKNRYTKESKEFCRETVNNLERIQKDLKNLTIKAVKYTSFEITKPKRRLIFAPDFYSKIIQISINNILMPKIEKVLINDTYASIKGRGTHKAAGKIQHNMRCAKRKWGNKAYTLKLDIKKFFYNIDRDILKSIFRKYIKDERLPILLDLITDSAEQIGDKGLPLGNTISQLSANLYLNELDHYLKRRFSLRYYVRYMDDIIIQVESKEKALEVLKEARRFLKSNLKLELNENKSQYQRINKCVNSVGYKIWTTHRKLRLSSKKSFKSIIKESDIDKYKRRIVSWLGSATKASHYRYLINNTSRLSQQRVNALSNAYYKITGTPLIPPTGEFCESRSHKNKKGTNKHEKQTN